MCQTKKGRDTGRRYKDDPQKSDPMDDCPSVTAYS